MSSDLEPAEPAEPPDWVSDLDRQMMVDRIQQALADDHVTFAELDQRFELVYAARTRAELERAAAGLPEPRQPPPPRAARHLAPATSFSLVGDTKVGGWIATGSKMTVTTLIGDSVIDLSSADIPPGGLELTVVQVVGDTKVIVPDGARVQLDSLSLIGDRTEGLVPPAPGGPTVRVRTWSAIGDTSVYSLSQVPQGTLRRLWTAFRDGGDQPR